MHHPKALGLDGLLKLDEMRVVHVAVGRNTNVVMVEKSDLHT